MKLNKSSAQAALALAYLAVQEPGIITQARHVASHLGIPTDSALKILQALTRRELIISQLGRGGGYRLDKSADQITLAQVVEAIDGPINGSTALAADPAGSDAALRSLDRLQMACEEAAICLRRELMRTTVADLVSASAAPAPQPADNPDHAVAVP